MFHIHAVGCLSQAYQQISGGEVGPAWFVDNSVGVSGNGTSWATAWKNLSNITGVSPGDTVYISGGSTYSTSGFSATAGNASNRVTYKIGQSPGHNGTATINCNGGTLPSAAYVTWDGDAGDGGMHFVLTNPASVALGTYSHAKYLYINAGIVNRLIYIGGISSPFIELGYCFAQSTTTADSLCYWDIVSGTGYGDNVVHHCELVVSNDGPGIGADCFQGSSHTDFHDNYIHGITNSYSAGQHQDGNQPLWGFYIRIWNSRYDNLSNYPIFFDGYYDDFSHVRIYNNIFTITSSAIQNGSPQGIVLGPDGGALKVPIIFTDVVVANNTVVDMGSGHQGISMYNPGGPSAGTWIDVFVHNNAIINCADSTIHEDITYTNNVVLSSGVNHVVSYSNLNINNNYHLIASDTSFRGVGLNLYDEFPELRFDKDGVARPSAGAWDVGCFQYVP